MFKNKKIIAVSVCLWTFFSGAFSGTAAALADPTQPSSYRAASKKQSLRLESILFSAARKVAVINGIVVAEGDSIGNAKIIKIDKESVQVRSAGKIVKLVLRHTTIRQEK
ncbi:MAG: hypothetical protein V3T17_08295 [Pseudomonadales bacterium]